MSQLEIFKKENFLLKSQRKDPHFLRKIFSYEKVIIFIIIFIVINIVSFSLGVEKGKRLVKISVQTTQETNGNKLEKQGFSNNLTTQQNKDNAISIIIQKEEPKNISEEPKNQITPKTNYTIQVASFGNKTYVQKEIGALKNKGYSVFTLSKGNMTIICVGKFQDKEKAKNLAAQLKKKYRDCLVRRL